MDAELFKAAVRMAISLPLVAALAYFILKYSLGRRTSGPFGRRRMRVLEQAALGPKATLTLVQVGQEYYLLAHLDGAVTVIKEMHELPEVLADSTPAGPEFNNMVQLFASGMSKLINRDRAPSSRSVGERRER
jgi:flagellar protein FliO/FliZ